MPTEIARSARWRAGTSGAGTAVGMSRRAGAWGKCAPRPLILIAAPDGPHPALARLTAGPRYETLVVGTGESALRALYEYRPDGLILGLRLPGLDPWEVLGRVRDMSDPPVAVVDRRGPSCACCAAATAGRGPGATRSR